MYRCLYKQYSGIPMSHFPLCYHMQFIYSPFLLCMPETRYDTSHTNTKYFVNMVVLEISLPNCVFVTPVSLMNKQEIEIFVRLKNLGFTLIVSLWFIYRKQSGTHHFFKFEDFEETIIKFKSN